MSSHEILKSEIETLLDKTRHFRQGGELASFFETLAFIKQSRYLAPYNALLVMQQRPNAAFVLSEDRWQKRYGRQLRHGVQPIVIMKIFGPIEFVYDIKDIEGIEEYPILGYHPNLPTEEICHNLFPVEGDLRGIKGLFDNMVWACRKLGLQFEEHPLEIDHAGQLRLKDTMYLTPREEVRAENRLTNYIIQVNGMYPLESRFATLIHELAHIFCGHLDEFKDVQFKRKEQYEVEFEAEAVSYLFCYRHGFRPKSEQYLAGYLTEGRTPSVASFGPIIDALKKIEDMLKPVVVRAAPKKLSVAIGGYLGSSYRLDLYGDILTYEEYGEGFKPVRTVDLKPTPKEWGNFRLTCDTVGLWSWMPEYTNIEICDGTNWSIDIILESREISTSGSNAFPGENEHQEEYGYPPPFRKFLNAVRKLTGGLPFE